MRGHLYQFKGKFRLQKVGGATGLDLTGDLADLIMIWWDEQFLKILETLSVDVGLYKRFKDDINLILGVIPGGLGFSKEFMEIIYENCYFGDTEENLSLKFGGKSFTEIYEEKRKSIESQTIKVVKNIADSIEPMIQFTCDVPSNHIDGMLPVLDVKAKLDHEGEILFDFYEKSTKNRRVILASSALPWQQKLNILTNEALRRLRNTSEKLGLEVQNNHLNDFMIKLKDSGYSPGFRQQVVVNAKKIYQSQVQKDRDGSKPLYRPRHLIDSDRAAAKNKSYKWWNKKGTPPNAVMFVPPTPGGKLLRD